MAYRRFAERLRGSDYVFTFNYDTLVEESLEVVGRPYRLFPDRFESIGISSNTVDTSRNDEEVVLLKLHGSIDWFERSSYDNKVAHMRQLAEETEPGIGNVFQGYEPPSPVFGAKRIVEPIPLVDGPRSDDDPLLAIYRVIDPAPLYRRGTGASPLLGAAPFLLTPSYQKLLYSSAVKEFWNGMGRGGGWSLGMGIIGFSLPMHDGYVSQALYEFIGNYTGFSWNENFFGKLKLPLRLVDLQETEAGRQNYRQRYGFCDWSRTEVFFGGFNQDAVAFLFEETRPVDTPSSEHSASAST